MPEDRMNELELHLAMRQQREAYRKQQRRTGEVSVALRLVMDLIRESEEDKSLLHACDHLMRARNNFLSRLRKMEREAGCSWGDL